MGSFEESRGQANGQPAPSNSTFPDGSQTIEDKTIESEPTSQSWYQSKLPYVRLKYRRDDVGRAVATKT